MKCRTWISVAHILLMAPASWAVCAKTNLIPTHIRTHVPPSHTHTQLKVPCSHRHAFSSTQHSLLHSCLSGNAADPYKCRPVCRTMTLKELRGYAQGLTNPVFHQTNLRPQSHLGPSYSSTDMHCHHLPNTHNYTPVTHRSISLCRAALNNNSRGSPPCYKDSYN